jgi:hypothetical protein
MDNVKGSSQNYCKESYVSSEVEISRSEGKTGKGVPILSL